jgi:hypothetical protein
MIYMHLVLAGTPLKNGVGTILPDHILDQQGHLAGPAYRATQTDATKAISNEILSMLIQVATIASTGYGQICQSYHSAFRDARSHFTAIKVIGEVFDGLQDQVALLCGDGIFPRYFPPAVGLMISPTQWD